MKKLRFVTTILFLFVALQVNGQPWPKPGANTADGRRTVAVPPTLRFVGRVLDSHDTPEGVMGPSAMRGRRVRVSVPLDTIVIGFGSAIGDYKLSRLLQRMASGEQMTWTVRNTASRELMLGPDQGWWLPQPGVDVREPLQEVDIDDRGVVYVAATMMGTAFLGTNLQPIAIVPSSTITGDPVATAIRAVKIGGVYFAIASSDGGGTARYRMRPDGVDRVDALPGPVPPDTSRNAPAALASLLDAYFLPGVSTGEGYTAIYGQRRDGLGADLRLFRSDGSEVPLGGFFRLYYSRNPDKTFATPAQSGLDTLGLGCDVAIFATGGKVYLVAAAIGLTDVYEIVAAPVPVPAPQPQAVLTPASTPVPMCPCPQPAPVPQPAPQPAPVPVPVPVPVPTSAAAIVVDPLSNPMVGAFMFFQVQPPIGGNCVWRFGDSSPTFTTLCSRTGQHIYGSAGTFTVSVTASVPVAAKAITIR